MICSFFGHRDAPDSAKALLEKALNELLNKQDISAFYVGNNGNFDKMVQIKLRELSKHNNIKYYIVLFSLTESIDEEDLANTVFPEGIEKVPHRFRICWRNEWMIKNSDIVITYVTHPSSGAEKYKQIAQKQKRKSFLSFESIFLSARYIYDIISQ